MRSNALDAIIDHLARTIYEKKQQIAADPKLLRETSRQLLDAVFSGYGNSIVDIDYGTSDFRMLDKLVRNTFHFSGAKNYQELRDMTIALRDKDRVRDFSEYMRRVSEINANYNVNWLRTEYETAVASAQSAARWTEFEREKDIMPMLKYQTIGDARVRESHKALDGVKKPIGDAFWDSYYPPNGWNCRCEAVQVTGKATATPNDKIQYPPVPQIFKTNMAKQGVVFPVGHPYYVGVPWDILSQPLRHAVNRYYQDLAFSWVDKNITEGITEIPLENFKTGKVVVTRSSLKRDVIDHLTGSDKLLARDIMEQLPEAEFFEFRELIKEKPNYKEKITRRVTGYNYYTLKIGGEDFVINVEIIGDKFEKLYAVRRKQKRN